MNPNNNEMPNPENAGNENLRNNENPLPGFPENETPASEAPENETPIPEAPEAPDFSNEERWAETLHMRFDAEEARRAATPPPYEPENTEPQIPPYGQPQQYYSDPQRPDSEPTMYYGAPQSGVEASQQRQPMPPTYLVWAIIATICCCLPSGIVAIIFSANVSSKYYARDFEGARRASRRAQWWIIISIVVGIIVNSLYVPLTLLLP